MTTYHAIQRVKQRTNLERGSEERFIKNAVARGRGAESFESIEREYLKVMTVQTDVERLHTIHTALLLAVMVVVLQCLLFHAGLVRREVIVRKVNCGM